MLNPAHTIIKICGGFRAVADMTDRTEVRVRRWTYPKDKGGTDGLIPSDCQQRLLIEARKRGIDLRPEHFFGEGIISAPATPSEDAA
ncbi:MAG: hypothetical protein A2341_14915 [Deltaproteobacteria bacterium RIFOXYB12_FULL_58_9]|nr:MAG: hypothetical protein A2341_14915 [Deltaproteobacteria bacterium RIFOXYB12_FULL_58_9]